MNNFEQNKPVAPVVQAQATTQSIAVGDGTTPIHLGQSDERILPNGEGCFTGGASAVAAPEHQDTLVLADIETRLAQEVRGLIVSIGETVKRQQLICKELPDSARFCKLITGTHRLVLLQFAYALSKGVDERILFDDGAQYLRQVGLSLNELFCEVNLNGRRFQAVAFIDQQLTQVDGAVEAVD